MSRLLAWCAGASVGYVVGFLAGSAVRDLTSLRTAGRARTGLGAPQPLLSHYEMTEAMNAAQIGVQRRRDRP